MSKHSRKQVYAAIDEERDYQDSIWNESTTPTKGIHETAAFILYMDEYLTRAKRLSSMLPQGEVDSFGEKDLDFVRKVTALGVACMEQNGAPQRIK